MSEELQEYTINVAVQGYNLSLDIKVQAKNNDDACSLACAKEFRYQDGDPYCLLVFVNDMESSVLCTYPTLQEALEHCETITEGNWCLVFKESDGEGTIIKSSMTPE